jgi:hypothetical protein
MCVLRQSGPVHTILAIRYKECTKCMQSEKPKILAT